MAERPLHLAIDGHPTGAIIIRPRGRLDYAVSEQLKLRLAQVVTAGATVLVVTSRTSPSPTAPAWER